MKLYVEDDVDTSVLEGARIAVLGYGSQGRAHALNLKDSGHNVVVGLRPEGASWAKAVSDGMEVATAADAVNDADLVAFLMPDMVAPVVFKEVSDKLKSGCSVLFAHGFNVHYGQIKAPDGIDVILVAPKGPGDLVRRQYQEGRGVPCLFAVEKDASGQARGRAMGYAHSIGGTRAGVIETTIAEETETDLFGEQAVLCGGATELVLQGFETLTEAGYQPEVAYFECMHELKLIVDLLYEGGLAKMHEFISETAKFGDLTRGPRVIDASTKDRMREVLTEIQDGTFAKEWTAEHASGLGEYNRMMEKDLAHPIESVGRRLRDRMSWIKSKSDRAA